MNIFINNIQYNGEVSNGSISINLKTNGDRSASLSIFDVLPSVKDGDELEIFDGTDKIFGGIIKSYSVKYFSPLTDDYPVIEVGIDAESYNFITNRRIVNVNVQDRTVGSIVNDMWSILSTETIYKGTFYTGPTIDYVAEYKTIKTVLDELADTAGCIWYIDNSRTLQFVRPVDVISNSPYALELNSSFTDFHDIAWSGSIENYANKVFVLGANNISIQKQSDSEIAERSLEADGAGTGVYGAVIDDDKIKTTVQAESIADNYLKRTAVRPGQLSFSTYTKGFLPGQKLRVQIPQITGYDPLTFPTVANIWYYLIQDVDIELGEGGIIKYSISAVRRYDSGFTTQRSPGFKDYFKDMSKFWF
jgi:hypothetical protein